MSLEEYRKRGRGHTRHPRVVFSFTTASVETMHKYLGYVKGVVYTACLGGGGYSQEDRDLQRFDSCPRVCVG
jgi:hypothetical protein